jgi:hypothetical protein
MGEIKSTLDLVMEKTRNLTLSAEEKQQHKQMEIESRIKGLLQKLKDGLLTITQFKIDYERLKMDSDLSDDRLLVSNILTRLDPDQDTSRQLKILEECCRLDTSEIRTDIQEYRDACEEIARQRIAQLKELLAQKHSITGSAVIPNLDADDQWQHEVYDLRRQLQDKLSRAKDTF